MATTQLCSGTKAPRDDRKRAVWLCSNTRFEFPVMFTCHEIHFSTIWRCKPHLQVPFAVTLAGGLGSWGVAYWRDCVPGCLSPGLPSKQGVSESQKHLCVFVCIFLATLVLAWSIFYSIFNLKSASQALQIILSTFSLSHVTAWLSPLLFQICELESSGHNSLAPWRSPCLWLNIP